MKRPSGRGPTTPGLGDLLTMVLSLLPTGMILQDVSWSNNRLPEMPATQRPSKALVNDEIPEACETLDEWASPKNAGWVHLSSNQNPGYVLYIRGI